MDFLNEQEIVVGEIPFIVKEALVLIGYNSYISFNLLKQEDFGNLINELSAQIGRFSNGGGTISNRLQVLAKQHLDERGHTADDYHIPFAIENQIKIIFQKCQTKTARTREHQPIDALRIADIREQANVSFRKITTEDFRRNLNEVEIQYRNAKVFAICPACNLSLNIWDKTRKVVHLFNFNEHVKRHIARNQQVIPPADPPVSADQQIVAPADPQMNPQQSDLTPNSQKPFTRSKRAKTISNERPKKFYKRY